MTPEDNLEKYFKKVLNEDSPLSEEAWSIPSDDLWEAAKVHFPKKKKKNRAIFFWFGMGICCLFLGVGIFSLRDFKVDSKPNKVVTKNKIQTEDSQNTKTNQTKEFKSREKNIAIPKSTQQVTTTNKLPEIEPSRKSQKTILQKKKTKQSSPKNQVIFANSLKEIKVKNQAEPKQRKLENDQSTIPNSIDKSIASKKIALLNGLKHPIPFLAIPERRLILKDNGQNLTVPIKPKFKQWEVGLSYAPFILIQESIINEGATSNFASQTIGIKHQNINLSLRRYLSPRFSLSSGLYLSKGEIDLTLCDKGVYENNNNMATLRYFLGDSKTTNEISLSDIGLDLDASFEYVDDARLKPGDELTLKGNIPFELKLVQMPVLFNLHFGRRKLKGLIHTGISLDYLSTKVNDVKWEVYKETELISKPIKVAPLHEQTFKVRLQAGLGLRYAIKDFLQIGTGININISTPLLSRYDLGIYYGF